MQYVWHSQKALCWRYTACLVSQILSVLSSFSLVAPFSYAIALNDTERVSLGNSNGDKKSLKKQCARYDKKCFCQSFIYFFKNENINKNLVANWEEGEDTNQPHYFCFSQIAILLFFHYHHVRVSWERVRVRMRERKRKKEKKREWKKEWKKERERKRKRKKKREREKELIILFICPKSILDFSSATQTPFCSWADESNNPREGHSWTRCLLLGWRVCCSWCTPRGA